MQLFYYVTESPFAVSLQRCQQDDQFGTEVSKRLLCYYMLHGIKLTADGITFLGLATALSDRHLV